MRFARARVDIEAGGKAGSRTSMDNEEPPETPGPTSTFLPHSHTSHSKDRRRCGHIVGGTGTDVLKVAVYPLGLWVVITWLMFSGQ